MKNIFTIAPTPQLQFGEGKLSMLHSAIKVYGSRILLVTGAKSFRSSEHFASVLDQLQKHNIRWKAVAVSNEPTPGLVDDVVKGNLTEMPDAIVAIGGGSVLDAGKAISAMLPLREPVKHYLEGVGTKLHPGIKIPFIAIPTTAGTGSEAARNAVLSETGEEGYKRSIRHTNFIPNVAIVDPVLSVSCPASTTAASGMDAFTQLLESYLSTAGNVVMDALALEGLNYISTSLIRAYQDGEDIEARAGMALAAYFSGVTLTNAGLGLVHGFAASIGGYFAIPHGVICSSMMYAVNKLTIDQLLETRANDDALAKYAEAGKIFAKHRDRSDEYYIDFILALMQQWKDSMAIPRLRDTGISHSDFERIVAVTENKNNPVPLSRELMLECLALAF